MYSRRWAALLVLALWGSVAEAQNLGVGALRGDVPADATVGVLTGPVPANAGVGALSGSFPANTTIGGVRSFSGPSGAFTGNLSSNPIPAGLQGPVPADTPSGALTPALPNAPFGSPTPADIARRNEALGEIHLMDRSNASADSALDRSTAIREQTFGPRSPGVAEGLEGQARLLEKYIQNQARPVPEFDRADRAAELQDRANQIRKEAERPAPKR